MHPIWKTYRALSKDIARMDDEQPFSAIGALRHRNSELQGQVTSLTVKLSVSKMIAENAEQRLQSIEIWASDRGYQLPKF